MSEPITISVGGEAIVLPPIMNFAALERVWPAVKAMAAGKDDVEVASASIAVISGVLLETRPELTVPEIKKRLLVNRVAGTDERAGVIAGVDQLLIASGLVRQGEAVPAPPAPAATDSI